MTAPQIASAEDLADRFRAAACAADAHGWVGTSYMLRDLASQLAEPDLEADDVAAGIWKALVSPPPEASLGAMEEAWREEYHTTSMRHPHLTCRICGHSTADAARDLAAPIIYFRDERTCLPCAQKRDRPAVSPGKSGLDGTGSAESDHEVPA